MHEELIQAVRSKQIILFVGSGVSMALGLPNWSALVKEIGAQLGYDPDVFKLYGDNLQLAEYYVLKQGTIGPLRSWMDRKWHPDDSLIDDSRIHKAILSLDAPIIYTTNYDRWLEIAYAKAGKPFHPIINVGDFASSSEGKTQIVKFHGDFEDDASLVLSESSYFERLSFESPLDIKFRADSIGRTILFIGYSLSDINIRFLLYKLRQLWAGSKFEKARPKSFIFLVKPNPVQQEILKSIGVQPIVSDDDEGPSVGLAKFLEQIAKLAHE